MKSWLLGLSSLAGLACFVLAVTLIAQAPIPQVWGQVVCTQTFTTASSVGTIGAAISSAASGSTICLTGSFGTIEILNTGTKNPRVTVTSTPGQTANARFYLSVGVNGYNISNFSATSGAQIGVSGSTSGSNDRNITFEDVNFGTGQVIVFAYGFNNNNILFNRTTFGAFTAGPGDSEGRLHIESGGTVNPNPTGFTITNSTFGPGGCSDGVRVSARGVTVGPGNTFIGLRQSTSSPYNCPASNPPHVDAIQGYAANGPAGDVITGNIFIDNSVDLGWYDGSANETFTNNIIYHSAISGGDSGQLGCVATASFRHNTIRNSTISFNGKPNGDAGGCAAGSTNILIQDNLWLGTSSLSFNQNGTPRCNTGCTVPHNMWQTAGIVHASATDSLVGVPTFIGGSDPGSTWSGWQMASGSIGENGGTDGFDYGTNYYGAQGALEPVFVKVMRGGIRASGGVQFR